MTIGFTAVVRSGKRCRLHELAPSLWLLSIASWIGGILVVAFGPSVTGTQWLPFAVTGLVVGLLVLFLGKLPELHRSVPTGTGKLRSEVRPAIAMYFIATLLLLYCAASLRFYLVNLS